MNCDVTSEADINSPETTAFVARGCERWNFRKMWMIDSDWFIPSSGSSGGSASHQYGGGSFDPGGRQSVLPSGAPDAAGAGGILDSAMTTSVAARLATVQEAKTRAATSLWLDLSAGDFCKLRASVEAASSGR
eukprot:CAMPEP_0198326960 /NCGR_PEP_ID=MMETSP1450-20131203/14344_1 /TAXON_ID=753684 ORGANISM="Madagascaria erythrocladiodes, Strain CCMP3234" /NCGR_SAMPLE_ID=MMETSP1450 /ASSEMBLY_ACC=CAM_ASM_001115 /LENGTH=132 /DNA_ID=CAMNT_0044030967 /DNA_START=401 /DNA_END=800 /DNA_ORIENTATION=-